MTFERLELSSGFLTDLLPSAVNPLRSDNTSLKKRVRELNDSESRLERRIDHLNVQVGEEESKVQRLEAFQSHLKSAFDRVRHNLMDVCRQIGGYDMCRMDDPRSCVSWQAWQDRCDVPDIGWVEEMVRKEEMLVESLGRPKVRRHPLP